MPSAAALATRAGVSALKPATRRVLLAGSADGAVGAARGAADAAITTSDRVVARILAPDANAVPPGSGALGTRRTHQAEPPAAVSAESACSLVL